MAVMNIECECLDPGRARLKVYEDWSGSPTTYVVVRRRAGEWQVEDRISKAGAEESFATPRPLPVYAAREMLAALARC